ncbi:MBL fold metallo-hydrolase [Phyllobacterium sp. SYP-B3895]|uniref:MBL fold metallo-hydrolase n=1 Tax=Phyllobacterium sp. SYP-B3895 TaxID=2663240 RepID=UPI0012999D10|nr:MBL fold metallo-hydrolase [Phyllobacterium sp. SYP-B3895]MRG57809.1 MBL fold metallo-hydrolase [Phyllobacterium sp. SYP-B3895]
MFTTSRRAFFKAAAAGAVVPVFQIPLLASEADAGAVEPSLGSYSFAIGEFQVTMLCDGVFILPTDSFATNVQPEVKKPYFDAHYLAPDNVRLQANPLLIDTGQKRILVDAGLAPGTKWAAHAGRLSKSLAAAGVDPGSVDTVFLTHCHADHIGGLISDPTGQFPKADLVLSETELDLWNSPDYASKLPDWAAAGAPATQKVFAALGDRLHPIKGGADVATGVTAVETPGHTQGHMSLLVDSLADQLLITGDALANIHFSFDHPEWQIKWDHDQEKGVKTRKALLDRAASERLLVVGYHYPFPGVGHVVKEGMGYRWLPAVWIFDG